MISLLGLLLALWIIANLGAALHFVRVSKSRLTPDNFMTKFVCFHALGTVLWLEWAATKLKMHSVAVNAKDLKDSLSQEVYKTKC